MNLLPIIAQSTTTFTNKWHHRQSMGRWLVVISELTSTTKNIFFKATFLIHVCCQESEKTPRHPQKLVTACRRHVDPYIYPVRARGGGGAVRPILLLLGRRSVNLLPLAQRTRVIPSHLVMRRATSPTSYAYSVVWDRSDLNGSDIFGESIPSRTDAYKHSKTHRTEPSRPLLP